MLCLHRCDDPSKSSKFLAVEASPVEQKFHRSPVQRGCSPALGHPGSPREEERQQKLLDLRVHSKSVSKLGLPFDATQPSQSRRLA